MSGQGEAEPTVEEFEQQEIEIPLAFRLAHLGIDIAAVYPKLTIQQIADTLRIDRNLVQRPLERFNIEGERMLHEHQKEYFEHYPHYALELIREERAWREWYRSFPPKVNANQVAEAIGRSYGWTAKTLGSLYPNARQQKHGHRSRLYPKRSIQMLRDVTFATPPDENWPTIPALVQFTGRDRTWVLNRLSQTSIRPENRRQVLTGREFPHYPPDTLDVLREYMDATPPPAGNWLTTNAIQAVLGKSGNWVTRRLEATYLSTGEPRLDDMGVERIHYPPSTLGQLRDELRKLESYEPAGDWATISTIRAELGLHGVTLARLMESVEIESEMRLDQKSRPKLHFSPETQRRLAKKAVEVYGHPSANGWVTFSVAQRIIGRSAGWIRSQFEERRITSETRLDNTGHPLQHFDIEVVLRIKELGDTLDAGSMLSIDDIVERTQKSNTWVRNHLPETNIAPQKRFSRFGKFLDHYPESIVEDLLNL